MEIETLLMKDKKSLFEEIFEVKSEDYKFWKITKHTIPEFIGRVGYQYNWPGFHWNSERIIPLSGHFPPGFNTTVSQDLTCFFFVDTMLEDADAEDYRVQELGDRITSE